MEKVLMITGGTGSLGTAILKYMDLSQYKEIRVFSRDEQKQEALRNVGAEEMGVKLILGDIRDYDKLRLAMRACDDVIHCAALKIVPNSSYNPDELMLTNCVGTYNVIRAAIECQVDRLVVISSDKGVEPTTLYGATKMVAEQIAVQANAWSRTRISVVRFGNLIGSRGSLHSFAQRKFEEGKPFNITDESMTRFWVDMRRATLFLSLFLEKMEGGEIFVPKLEARTVLSMLPKGAVWNVVGKRPGERTYEVLVGRRELEHTDEEETYYVIQPYPYHGSCRRTNSYRSDAAAPRYPDPDEGGVDAPAEQVPAEADPGPDTPGDDLPPVFSSR